MFPSSNASDAEKYPISVESKLHLSESVAVSFVIQHCDAFSKKNTQRSKFSKLLSVRSSRYMHICFARGKEVCCVTFFCV